MFPILTNGLAWLSRVCGFDTINSFPPGSAHARTHWNRAYFDIASDLKPEQIERSICTSIANTPSVFVHIANPTPGMQRALLDVIEARVRHAGSAPVELVGMLINAYRSPYTIEVVPGLRETIGQSEGANPHERVRSVLAFLGAMPAAYDIIEAT
jgi:hypothetical protein